MPAKKPDRKFETPKILHDWPLKNEQAAYFKFDDFAVTLARLIAAKETATPLTIGISGKWGAGKTTLLRRIQKMLDATSALYDPTQPAILEFCGSDESPQALFRPCRTVWFNAWKYADEEQLLVALIRVIVQEMSRDDVVSQVLAKLLDPAYPRRDVVATVLGWFSIKVGAVDLKPNTGQPRETRFSEKTATLDLFSEALDRLMAAWVHRSLDMMKVDQKKGVLVVFVDDLDRCLPPKMVQVLEAVKLFMDKEGGVFVLGADTEIVRQAIEKQYETAGVKGQSASDYLEKIMQLRFELPVSSHDDMQTLLDGEKIIGADWGDSWRLLITGAEINPRKVKTFVNGLNLQWAMLVNSGQARHVNRADFNAWQVLMRVAPPNFVQQARERIDDVELRYNFVMDAIKWGRGEGDETLKTTFQEYDSWRLRRVLKEIAFSAEFNAPVLDAFVHLVAPPEKEQPKPEPVPEQPAGKTPAQAREVEREELPVDFSLQAEPEALETAKGVTRGGDVGRDGIPPHARPSREGAIVVKDMEFMPVPKGKFLMGSKDDDKDVEDREKPQHTVEIPYDYWLSRFTVTNEQYNAFIKASGGQHPVSGWEKKKDHPAEQLAQLLRRLRLGMGRKDRPVLPAHLRQRAARLGLPQPGSGCGDARCHAFLARQRRGWLSGGCDHRHD